MGVLREDSVPSATRGLAVPAHRLPAQKPHGLTLIELIVVVAIVAVLGTLAAPSFNDFLIRNRSSAMANDLTASVMRARNEAITRNTCVVVCRSTDLGDERPSCAAGADDWQVGWVTFLDDSCQAVTRATDAAQVVSVSGPFPGAFSLVKRGANTTQLMFSASGNARVGDAGRFDLRHSDTERPSNRSICLNALGRTRVVTWQNNTTPACPT